MPIIQHVIEQHHHNGNDNGRKVFAALSIFDRIIVLAPIDWLRSKLNGFTTLLIAAYKYHREAMRSLIYIAIILGGDTSFLSDYGRERKIVEMMSKESDFTDWVKSHRVQ